MKKNSIVVFVFVLAVSSVFADDAKVYYDPTVGGMILSNSSEIEMTEEVINIWESKVKVTFDFKNLTDKTISVTMGFPVYPHDLTDQESEVTLPEEELKKKIIEWFDFKSTCNDKPLERRLEKSADENYSYWYVSDVVFGPHETLKITDAYNNGWYCYRSSIGDSEQRLDYVLVTGSSWANPIGKMKINFYSKGIMYVREKSFNLDSTLEDTLIHYEFFEKPDSVILDKKSEYYVYTWTFENIKPKKNWYLKEYLGYYYCDYYPSLIIYSEYLLKEKNLINSVYNGLNNDFGRFTNEEYYTNCTGRSYHFDYKALTQNNTNSDEMSAAKVIAQNLTAQEFYQDLVELYECSYKPCYGFQLCKKTKCTSIYALHGYKFKNDDWTKLFENFCWYKGEKTDIS